MALRAIGGLAFGQGIARPSAWGEAPFGLQGGLSVALWATEPSAQQALRWRKPRLTDLDSYSPASQAHRRLVLMELSSEPFGLSVSIAPWRPASWPANARRLEPTAPLSGELRSQGLLTVAWFRLLRKLATYHSSLLGAFGSFAMRIGSW